MYTITTLTVTETKFDMNETILFFNGYFTDLEQINIEMRICFMRVGMFAVLYCVMHVVNWECIFH